MKKRSASTPTPTYRDESDSAWPDDDSLKMCTYGESGSGKTTLWSTFPGPILALICSGLKKPGELKSVDTPEYRKKITAKVLSSPENLEELIEGADQRYRTVVLDYGAGLQNLVIKGVLGLEKTPSVLYRVAAKGEAWGVVSQKQWGQVNIQVIELLRSIISLDCNVVIVSQQRTFDAEEETGLIAPHIGPDFTPGISRWLRPAVDYGCQMFIRGKTEEKKVKIAGKITTQQKRVPGVEYCLRTLPHEVYWTKFRLPRGTKLPEYIVDPTFNKINRLIQGD